MENNESIHVWCDWESTGIWTPMDEEGHLANDEYERFNLPQDLITRFKYWERWFSDAVPGWNNKQNKTDKKLYDAYGLSLAVDLKRFIGEKHRVFYGVPHYTDEIPNYNDCKEIILVEREKVEKEEGRIVPVAIPYKK